MKESTKKWFSDIFVSQVKNERAIEAAKTRPWWVALIMFIVGTFLPVIPLMVTQGNTYGSYFMNQQYKYGFDQDIAEATVKLDKEGYRLEIKDGELLAYNGDKKLVNTWVENKDMTPIASLESFVEKTKTVKLNVYYTDRPYSKGDATVRKVLTELNAIKYAKGIDTVTAYDSNIHENGSYTPSFILLHKTGAYASIYKSGTSTIAYSTYSGFDWKKNPNTTNLLKDLLTVDGISIADQVTTNSGYVKAINKNWSKVFDLAYQNQKVVSFWTISGIFYGLYLLLNIFMGFMMWLLTRGKMNPNRGLKVTTCWWISGWTCVAPGLLALVVGFVYAPAQQVAFIVLLGLRTMWLSMRQLNPKY